MNFLRENIILVAIVAVTLIGGIVLTVAIRAASEAADAGLNAREELNNRLEGNRQQNANEQIIKEEQIWVQTIRNNTERLVSGEILENRKGYELLTYTLPDASDGSPRNLFPVTDPKLFDKHAPLPWQITKTYGEKLQAILMRLNPTTVPTEPEIKEELLNIQRRLENEARKKEVLDVNKTTGQNTPDTAVVSRTPAGPFGTSPMPGNVQILRGINPSVAGEKSVSQEMQDKARENAIVRKAKQGRIYADMAGLDVVFREPQFKVEWPDLWWAQVNLWITGDIIDAIAATNDQVLSQLEEGQRNVINSPVKQLITLAIGRKYFTGGTAGSVGTSAGRGSMMPSVNLGGPSGPPLNFNLPGRSIGGQATSTDGGGETLTRHTSTTEYDVVLYEFSVVTAVRHLPLLLRNLETGNRNTVLTITMNSVDPTSGSNFYYSNESVMRVTISGEARFLTAWERGTKGGAYGEGYPSLMPIDVLKEIPQAALRAEDKQRLGGGGT